MMDLVCLAIFKTKKAFTLLEIIIVIIIVGVLTSLALPRFFKMIQYSYSAEAFSGMQAIRGSLERCYIARMGTYQGCTYSVLDITNPSTLPNTHFEYDIFSASATGYQILATRRTLHGGSPTNTISLTVAGQTITKSGTTIFSGIQ